MFLRCKARNKDGKRHRYWSVVENRRVRGGRFVQRQVLYLGEINDSQEAAWRRSIEVFAEGRAAPVQMALFPEDRPLPAGPAVLSDSEVVQIDKLYRCLDSPRRSLRRSQGRLLAHKQAFATS